MGFITDLYHHSNSHMLWLWLTVQYDCDYCKRNQKSLLAGNWKQTASSGVKVQAFVDPSIHPNLLPLLTLLFCKTMTSSCTPIVIIIYQRVLSLEHLHLLFWGIFLKRFSDLLIARRFWVHSFNWLYWKTTRVHWLFGLLFELSYFRPSNKCILGWIFSRQPKLVIYVIHHEFRRHMVNHMKCFFIFKESCLSWKENVPRIHIWW